MIQATAPAVIDVPSERSSSDGSSWAWWTCLLATTAWTVTFMVLVMRRHDRFATFDFDLGIHSQAIWLMAHDGHGFLTVRGLPALGHHATFAYWLLAPFSWLGAGPHVWNILQVFTLAAVAPLLFHLSHRLGARPWLALFVSLAFLAHPSSQSLIWETFHPDVMGLPWLVGAVIAAVDRRWRVLIPCAVMAMCWKEDFALPIVTLAVVLAWSDRRDRAGLLRAAGLGLLAAVWFVMTALVLMPGLVGGSTHAGTFYGDLGTSMTEVAVNVVRNPSTAWRHLGDSNALYYLLRVWGPFGFICLLAPRWLLLGLPMLTINLLSTAYFVYDPQYHYVSVPLAAAGIASAAAAGKLSRFTNVDGATRRRWFRSAPGPLRTSVGRQGVALGAVVAMVVGSLWLHSLHGVGPWGGKNLPGQWGIADRLELKAAAIRAVPGNAAVAATYSLAPHLSERRRVYTFPNPWRALNWGISGEDLDSPDDVDWLVIDQRHLGPDDLALFTRLANGGGFQVVQAEDDIVVARRIGSG
jgi:uncharacterized membrane protein